MGPKRRNARLRLYGFMMEDFTEEQKIQVAARIVQDLLAYAVDYLAGKPRLRLNYCTSIQCAMRSSSFLFYALWKLDEYGADRDNRLTYSIFLCLPIKMFNFYFFLISQSRWEFSVCWGLPNAIRRSTQRLIFSTAVSTFEGKL